MDKNLENLKDAGTEIFETGKTKQGRRAVTLIFVSGVAAVLAIWLIVKCC